MPSQLRLLFVSIAHLQKLKFIKMAEKPGANPGILKKRGWRYVSHHLLHQKKCLGFRWSKKVKIKLETISFLAKCFFKFFQILCIFKYNKSLSMKSHQIHKRLYKEREITLIHQSMRKNLNKVVFCFI